MSDLSKQLENIPLFPRERLFVICMALALIGGICSAVIGYILQNNVQLLHQFGVSGVFVSDAVALRETANVYWGRSNVLDATWRPIIGVMQFYWPGILWGSLAVCALNIFLILVAAYYFYKTIKAFVAESRNLLRVFFFVMISVVGNVYLVEVMAFPNKEIPLMAITNAYVYYLVVRRSYIAPVFLSFVAFLFRDGYGVILLGSLLAVWVLWNRPSKTRLTLIGLMVAVFALIPITSFVEISDIVARNVESGIWAEQFPKANEQLSYLARLKYNTISLAMLNSFLTDGGRLFLLNIGFWQLGVFVIAGVFWSIKQVLKETNEFELGISIVIIVTLVCISYGTFVQPRYLMPLSYFLSLGFIQCIKCGGIAVSLSIAVPVFLIFVGVSHKVPEIANATSWLW